MGNDKIYKSFTDLDVWKIARQYKNAIFELSKEFPPEEEKAYYNEFKIDPNTVDFTEEGKK